MGATSEQARLLRRQWASSPRWTGIRRDYTAQDVIRLRSSVAPGGALVVEVGYGQSGDVQGLLTAAGLTLPGLPKSDLAGIRTTADLPQIIANLG